MPLRAFIALGRLYAAAQVTSTDLNSWGAQLAMEQCAATEVERPDNHPASV
jgi:hypothetical protein